MADISAWTSYDGDELAYEGELETRKRFHRVDRQARRDLDAEEATDGLDEAEVASFYREARLPEDEEAWSIGGLLPAEGRALVAGYRKVGKTLLALNLAAAWADPAGGRFIGRFDCQPPPLGRRIVWLNLELTRLQARRWLKHLDIDDATAKAIVGVHARGRVSKYAPTTTHGRAELVALLRKVKADRLIVDPVAPLIAACGLNIADPKDTQMFLNAMERICREAGVREVVYITHVGKSDAKADDGAETALGSERWESAVDAIWVMGKEKESGERWFRAEGRDVDVPEMRILHDEKTGQLSLRPETEGWGRKAARLEELVNRVVAIVEDNPGTNKGDLRDHTLMKAKSKEAGSAISEAIRLGMIRAEKGPSNAILHYRVHVTLPREVTA